MKADLTRSTGGFTLVELVIVLILVGILALGGVGLFASRGDFSAALARDQLIARVLQAQQRALAQHSGVPVTLRIVQSSEHWFVSVFQGTPPADTSCTTDNAPLFKDVCIERAGAVLSIGGTSLTDGGSRDIRFNADGNTEETGNLLLSISGDESYPMCVTRAGFAYDGACL